MNEIEKLQTEGIELRCEIEKKLSEKDKIKLNRLIEIELLLEAESNQ